jgi:hypothetical protein
MKNIKLYITAFLFTLSLTAFGQDNMDVIKTIKTEEAKFLQDGTYVDKAVNIVEIRKQLVDTKPSQSSLLNQERLQTPIHITKTIRVDDNIDEVYDLSTKISYQIVNGTVKNLSVEHLNKNTKVDQEVLMLDGMKREGYVLGTEDTAVFGYINAENDFVVHYF